MSLGLTAIGSNVVDVVLSDVVFLENGTLVGYTVVVGTVDWLFVVVSLIFTGIGWIITVDWVLLLVVFVVVFVEIVVVVVVVVLEVLFTGMAIGWTFVVGVVFVVVFDVVLLT